MKPVRKSKRVSWATGVGLCQVKLFWSEDCPSKIVQKSQDHLKAKPTSILIPSIDEFNDLPPGFEGNSFLNQSRVEFSHIPQIKWKRPPQFILSDHWLLAAGEQSKEKEGQKLREMKVLEAVYPRLSTIPPSPFVSLDVEEEDFDDNHTPLIPTEEIESEDVLPEDMLPETAAALNSLTNVHNLQQHISGTTPVSLNCNTSSHPVSSPASSPAFGMPLSGISLASDADLAAASALVTTIMKSNEQGGLIDMDLLVKILNGSLLDMDLLVKICQDPALIERLIHEHRTAATVSAPSKHAIPAVPSSPPTRDVAAPVIPSTRTVGLLPSGLKSPTPASVLKPPTPDNSATLSFAGVPSVSSSLAAIPPVSPSVPLFRPLSSKPATLPVSHGKPVPPVPFSGVKRTASMASISCELSPVPLPSVTGNLAAVVNQVQPTSMPYQPSTTGSSFPIKDANYYKNLIRQHGAQKPDMQDSQIGIPHGNYQDKKPVHNIKQGEVKSKIPKPCLFFNTPKGCRNGSNCPYQHDVPVQCGAGTVLGARNAKRFKL